MREVKNCLTCFYGIDDGKDFPKIILVGKPLFKLSPHIGFYDFVGCFGPWGSIKPNCPIYAGSLQDGFSLMATLHSKLR